MLINNLLDDAATAEIARAQVWQWIHHSGGVLDDGRRTSREMIRSLRDAALRMGLVCAASCAAENVEQLVLGDHVMTLHQNR